MGMDFVALVRYHRTPEVVRRIAALDNQIRPVSAEVASLWAEQRFMPLPWERFTWVAHNNFRQMKRPAGPSLQMALRTVDGFYITFGQGVCCIYHLLRWGFFLTDPRWQTAMLGACDTLADLLEAPDGVVMSDFHPAYRAFFAGWGFEACLRSVPPEEGEVEAIADLYQVVAPEDTWTSHGYWRFRRNGAPVLGLSVAGGLR